MNILHLITSLKVGGAESALVNYLSKVVGQDGNTHSVAYFHLGPNVDKIRNLGVKTYQISGTLSIYDPVFFFRLAKLIQFIKPDVIHSSLWSANIIARLISKFSKIPVICDLHGNSFDEGRVRNWFDRRTVKYCAKIVAVSNSVKDAYLKNIMTSELNKPAPSRRQRLWRAGCGECARSARIDASAEATSERRLEPSPNGRRAELQKNLVVIKNGIDVQALRDKAFTEPLIRKNFGLFDDDFVIGAVGRLEPIKSYDVLIKAFASFCHPELDSVSNAQAKLVIVGDGSQAAALAALVKTLKIEKQVIFTGFRPDAYKFYQIFDCFALSSQSEGLSIALLEAMVFGLPIISTNLDISRHDVITPGINGLLVRPNDIEGYARAINKLFQDRQEDRGLKHTMGKRNLELVGSEFCIDGVVDRYQALYQDVVQCYQLKK